MKIRFPSVKGQILLCIIFSLSLIVLGSGWSTADCYITITVYFRKTPSHFQPLKHCLLCNDHHGSSDAKYHWHVWCIRCFFITACRRSCGKVMFLHLSVILFRGGVGASGSGVCLWVWGVYNPGHTHPLFTPTPPQSTSARYASYWNAFLL